MGMFIGYIPPGTVCIKATLATTLNTVKTLRYYSLAPALFFIYTDDENCWSVSSINVMFTVHILKYVSV